MRRNEQSRMARMALAVAMLATPVVGAVAIPSIAMAGEDGTQAFPVCSEDGTPSVRVEIDGDPSAKFYLVIGPEGSEEFWLPGSTEFGGFKSAGWFTNRTVEVDAGSHYWRVIWDNDGESVVWSDGFVDVDCEDAQGVSASCSSISVDLPSKPGGGEPFGYVVTLLKGGEEVDSAEGSSGESVVLSPSGSGNYVIVIDRDQGNKTTEIDVTVSCRRHRNSSSNTTPNLPTTGSGSSSSLLIVAPMMIALGGGLVLARRRMLKV